MDLQQKLAGWAERTADKYHDLAVKYPNDCNYAFYTQSDLRQAKFQPELMILAINPGSSGPYINDKEALVCNKMWRDWGVDQRMDGKTLLKGNPAFSEKERWRLWRMIRNILGRGGAASILDDPSNCIYTNLILFGTKKANKIPSICLKECPASTIELIQILQPKRILCLSIPSCFRQFQRITKFQSTDLIPTELAYGRWGDIDVYGIPHTSKYYSLEEMDMIGHSLGYLFKSQNAAITPENIQQQCQAEIDAWKNRKSPSRQLPDLLIKTL